MNDLKPEAFIINRLSGNGYGSPRTVVDGETYDPRKESFWLNKDAQNVHEVIPLVAIPPTHRVVSVELLEEIWECNTGYKEAFDKLRAIIDNKEQS